jgi:hypothetical protein
METKVLRLADIERNRRKTANSRIGAAIHFLSTPPVQAGTREPLTGRKESDALHAPRRCRWIAAASCRTHSRPWRWRKRTTARNRAPGARRGLRSRVPADCRSHDAERRARDATSVVPLFSRLADSFGRA